MSKLEWILIKGSGKNKNTAIGAVGMLGNDAVTVISFFDDADGNMDGNVSVGEWIAFKISPLSLKNRAVLEVAMTARYDMRILERDPSFYEMAMKLYLNFARQLVADGVYTVYFSRGVSMTGSGLAKIVTSSAVKQIVIRKGFESAVKAAFRQAGS